MVKREGLQVAKLAHISLKKIMPDIK